MQPLLNFVKRKFKALNYLLWNKVIIIASLYEYRIDNTKFALIPNIAGNFIVIDENNFEKYRLLFANENIDMFMERIYVYHDVCIAYLIGSKMVYRMFLTTRGIYYEPAINTNIEIHSDAAFLYDAQTIMEYRGHEIYYSSLPQLFSLASTLKKKRAFICVLDTNIPSRKTVLKIKFKVIKKYIFIPSLGITKSWDCS